MWRFGSGLPLVFAGREDAMSTPCVETGLGWQGPDQQGAAGPGKPNGHRPEVGPWAAGRVGREGKAGWIRGGREEKSPKNNV